MSSSQLKKFVVTPVVLSAAVFAVLTLPLAVFGSKPVTIQLQSEPVFHGQLRDVATPYLGLASALSVGTGIACIALTGWRQSTRKSSKVEEELSELAQNLKKREAELEALKWSESQLQAKGLSAFLDEEVTQKPVLEAPTNSLKTETKSVVEPLVITSQPLEAQPVISSSATVQASAAKFASTQTFLGYAQAHATAKPSPQVMTPTPQEVEQLHTQLQQIMSQMAALQTALSASQGVVKSEEQVPVGLAPLHVVKTGSVDRTA